MSAYAKINRYLKVTGVRADGYHTLQTVMQSISLQDTLRAEAAEGFAFTCSVPALETNDNLCVRAAKAYMQVYGSEIGCRLHLEKRIPTGAGLGGGSTDAAAVLRLLSAMVKDPLPEETLYRIAGSLGADVPFCLHGGRCYCTGIGEEMTPLSDGEVEALVIARGANGLSTPEMYRQLDLTRPWELTGWDEVGNDFEPVAVRMLPEISVLLQILREQGASLARMSGSGSAVFGVFGSEREASDCASLLQERGYFAVSCQTIPRY